MLIFSAKARQLIDSAVTLLGPSQQQVWLMWSSQYPRVRGPLDAADDRQGPTPSDVVDVVLAALEAQDAQMRRRLSAPGLSDDDVSDLDNDLTHLRAVERAIYEHIRPSRASA